MSNLVKKSCQAFSLVEVIVALTVMALMMVGLLSYVHSASILWQRGQNMLNVKAYYRAVSESLERDISQAILVHNPVGSTEPALKFDMHIRQGNLNGTGSFALDLTDEKLVRILHGTSSNFTVSDTPGTDNVILRSRYQYVVARNVATFTVTRLASHSIIVNLGLRSVLSGPNDGVEATKNATLTYILPSGR